MRAPTHATFGLGFTIATGTVLGVVLTPAVAVTALVGALLPDVDTPTSPIGRVCPPLARWLERRVGHRTLTHSLLGLGLAGLPRAPAGLGRPALDARLRPRLPEPSPRRRRQPARRPALLPEPGARRVPGTRGAPAGRGLAGRGGALRRLPARARGPVAAPPGRVHPRPPRVHADHRRRDHGLPPLGGDARGVGGPRRPLPALPAPRPPARPGARHRQHEHADRPRPGDRHGPHGRARRGRQRVSAGDRGSSGPAGPCRDPARDADPAAPARPSPRGPARRGDVPPRDRPDARRAGPQA